MFVKVIKIFVEQEPFFLKIFLESVAPDLNIMEWPCTCPIHYVGCIAKLAVIGCSHGTLPNVMGRGWTI